MSNLQKLKDAFYEASELAQNRNLELEDLQTIERIWSELPSWDPNKDLQQGSMAELLIDLQILNITGGHLGRFIKNIQVSTKAFSPAEYAEKLKATYTNLTDLADDAVKIINRAPGFPALLNTLPVADVSTETLVQKKRNVNTTSRKRDEKAGASQAPENLKQLEASQGTVDKKVRVISNLLRDLNKPVPFYKFILDPDFGKTIENIFHISFVIRDGIATLDIIDDEFVIFATKEIPQNVSQGQKKQMVFSMDYPQWESLIAEYNITEPMIP